MLTIGARRANARRCGSAARVVRTMPSTLTSSTRCHSASALASTVPWAPMPALLTSDVEPPELGHDLLDRRADRDVVGDVGTGRRGASGAARPRRGRSAATRRPARGSSSTVAAPMPEAPPVTTATRPSYSPDHAAAFANGTICWRCRPSPSISTSTMSPARQVGEAAGQRDTLGRAGEDEVAGVEGEVLAEVVDDVGDVEDLVGGGGVLARLAVDPAAQAERLVVDLVGGHQPGAQRG